MTRQTFVDLTAALLAAGGEVAITVDQLEAARSGRYAVTSWQDGDVTRLRVDETKESAR